MLPSLRTRTGLPSLVEEYFNGDFLPRFFDAESYNSVPSVNIVEGKNEYRIDVAAPGLGKEDFRIQVDKNILTVSSEKEEKGEEKDEKVMRKEFSYYSFKRCFSLPDTVNSDKIKASHKDGILEIVIPKREEAKEKPAREIKIS
ncbi:MAG: Hsp20/alpha crystallin family protein [Bacteroidales bacterium]|nr:Hsp20/alpha crystallin family protein [Bacteroidales bacterium]